MSTAIARYETFLATNDFVFLIYFRGHWCPFCKDWLKQLQALLPSIEGAHGQVVAVTAEEDKFLSDTRSQTGYKGEIIVDPEHSLAKKLKSEGLVNVAISSKAGYPNGMAQPAVLVVTREGKAVVSWAIEPSMMNLGGAKDRPVLKEVWADAQKRLANKDAAACPQTQYRRKGFMGLLGGLVKA